MACWYCRFCDQHYEDTDPNYHWHAHLFQFTEPMSLTDNPNDPRLGHGWEDEPKQQNEAYLVFSEEEKRKMPLKRMIRKSYVHDTCGGVTMMATEIAETYARDPKFYGATYCVHCKKHRPVAEFKWLGTDERVGS